MLMVGMAGNLRELNEKGSISRDERRFAACLSCLFVGYVTVTCCVSFGSAESYQRVLFCPKRSLATLEMTRQVSSRTQ